MNFSSSHLQSEGQSESSTMIPARSPLAAKNVPAFLNKLYAMVSDPSTNSLIHWSEDGLSFLVHRQEDFAKEVLPRFFKHNNAASFVRQLNMYGFHKVPHLQQGSLLNDGLDDVWEFSNPNFQRNQPDLLCLVTRKKGQNTASTEEPKESTTPVDLNHIIQEVAAIRRHQITISADLKNIQRDNQSLWTESISLRERYAKQQDTIDKILGFLASVFSSQKTVVGRDKKRKLFLEELDQAKSDPVIEEPDDEVVTSKKRKSCKFLITLTLCSWRHSATRPRTYARTRHGRSIYITVCTTSCIWTCI